VIAKWMRFAAAKQAIVSIFRQALHAEHIQIIHGLTLNAVAILTARPTKFAMNINVRVVLQTMIAQITRFASPVPV